MINQTQTEGMKITKKALLWLIFLRLIVITSLFVSAVIIQYTTSVFLLLSPIYYMGLFFFFISFIYFILYLWGKYLSFQFYLQIVFDLILITALVYISGGLNGSFYFLYIFEIIVASIVLSKLASYLIASLSAILFACLVDGMYFGIIPYFNPEQSMEISLGLVTSNILIAWCVFFIVALLTNYLTGSLKKTKEELRLIQKELEIKNRLAVAGQAAAQVAHEIRNPLAAISGSIQVLKKELDLNEEQRDLMDIVVKESTRASQSMEQFLSLASPARKTLSYIDLSKNLKETLMLLQRSGEVNGDIRIEGNYESSNVRYFGNSNQFKQLFWNIIKNAIKAMPNGGTLTIDFLQSKRDEIILRFADTGKGMEAKEREKVFEPFFSGFEDGDGLGMALVGRIINDYKGKVEVASKLDEGTEILIKFPLENKDHLA